MADAGSNGSKPGRMIVSLQVGGFFFACSVVCSAGCNAAGAIYCAPRHKPASPGLFLCQILYAVR